MFRVFCNVLFLNALSYCYYYNVPNVRTFETTRADFEMSSCSTVSVREIARVEKIMQDFTGSHAVNLIHVNAEYELIRTEIVDAVAKIDSAAKRNAEIDIKEKEAEPTVAQRNAASKLIMEKNHDR
jgi:hypothetical protein